MSVGRYKTEIWWVGGNGGLDCLKKKKKKMNCIKCLWISKAIIFNSLEIIELEEICLIVMIPSCSNSNGVRRKAIKSDKKMYLWGVSESHELKERLQRTTWGCPLSHWAPRRRRYTVTGNKRKWEASQHQRHFVAPECWLVQIQPAR